MVIDITNFLEKLKYELFYRKEDTFNLKVKNPDNLSKLKQIKSVIIDKNQTITDNQLTISGLVISNEFFEINDHEILAIRDILSQMKNEKPPRRIESLREIPDEENDATSRLDYNMTIKSNLFTDESNRVLMTDLMKPDIFKIPNFDLVQEKEHHIRLYSERRIINSGHPADRINSLKASVYVDPSAFMSEENVNVIGRNINPSIFRPKMFKQICEENFYEINDLLITLILCHFTRTKIDVKNNNYTHESIHEEIGSILSFCEKFGYSFKGSYKVTENKIPVYEINTCSQPEYYPIIGFNEMTKNRTRFSIIVGRPLEKNFELLPNQGTTLYVHGDDADQMIHILNLSSKEKETLRAKIENLRETGNMTIIYAKKELSSDQTKKFIKRKKIIKTSLTIKEEEMESLYNSIEEKLDLICVVCLKEKMRPHVLETIHSFHEAQMKVYFVSADNECSTLASAFQAGIIKKNVDIYKIQVNNQNAALLSLKLILEKIKKKQSSVNINGEFSPLNMFENTRRFDFSVKNTGFDEASPRRGVFGMKTDDNSREEQKELCILIDGESFEIIYKNKYLRNHFLFLLLFCGNVSFNFSALEKKRLAKLIKRLDSSTNHYVLGIGDGYDDIQMLQKCDLSIEIKSSEGETVTFMGDFIVDDFKKISDLVFFRGNELFIKNEEIMLYLFYVFWTLLMNLFYFSWFSDFTGMDLMTPANFDVLTVIMSIQIIIVYFLFEGKTTVFLTNFFPSLYKNDMREGVGTLH